VILCSPGVPFPLLCSDGLFLFFSAQVFISLNAMAGYLPFTAKGGIVDEAYRKVWGVCMQLADGNLKKTKMEYKGLELLDGDETARAHVVGFNEARLRATRAQVMATAVAADDISTAAASATRTAKTAATAITAGRASAARAAGGATRPTPSTRRPGEAPSAASRRPSSVNLSDAGTRAASRGAGPARASAPAPCYAPSGALGGTGTGDTHNGSPGAAGTAAAATAAAAAAVAAADTGDAEAMAADEAATAAAAAAAAAITAGDDLEDEDAEEGDDNAEDDDDEDDW